MFICLTIFWIDATSEPNGTMSLSDDIGKAKSMTNVGMSLWKGQRTMSTMQNVCLRKKNAVLANILFCMSVCFRRPDFLLLLTIIIQHKVLPNTTRRENNIEVTKIPYFIARIVSVPIVSGKKGKHTA